MARRAEQPSEEETRGRFDCADQYISDGDSQRTACEKAKIGLSKFRRIHKGLRTGELTRQNAFRRRPSKRKCCSFTDVPEQKKKLIKARLARPSASYRSLGTQLKIDGKTVKSALEKENLLEDRAVWDQIQKLDIKSLNPEQRSFWEKMNPAFRDRRTSRTAEPRTRYCIIAHQSIGAGRQPVGAVVVVDIATFFVAGSIFSVDVEPAVVHALAQIKPSNSADATIIVCPGSDLASKVECALGGFLQDPKNARLTYCPEMQPAAPTGTGEEILRVVRPFFIDNSTTSLSAIKKKFATFVSSEDERVHLGLPCKGRSPTSLGGSVRPAANVLRTIASRGATKEDGATQRVSVSQLKPGSAFWDCRTLPAPKMVVIPAGSFSMGRSDGQPEERPVHTVNLKRTFAIGKYPVTFIEWEAFERATIGKKRGLGDHGWGRGTRPVVSIPWHRAEKYSEWLSEVTGAKYRLPSEAEWEYCCRSGTTTNYSCGDVITQKQARFAVKSTRKVGTVPANAFGICDMHGNVWEWCADDWHNNYKGAPSDGGAWLNRTSVSKRVLRGGSWWNKKSADLTSARRVGYNATNRDYTFGFRVVREL